MYLRSRRCINFQKTLPRIKWSSLCAMCYGHYFELYVENNSSGFYFIYLHRWKRNQLNLNIRKMNIKFISSWIVWQKSLIHKPESVCYLRHSIHMMNKQIRTNENADVNDVLALVPVGIVANIRAGPPLPS